MQFSTFKSIQARIATSIITVCVAFLAVSNIGCQQNSQNEAKDSSKKPPSETKDGKKIAELQKQLFDSKVEIQKLANTVMDFRSLKEKEKSTSPENVASEETQNKLAEAQVKLSEKLAEMNTQFRSFVDQMKASKIDVDLSPKAIDQIVKAVEEERKNKSPENGNGGSEDGKGTGKTGNGSGDSKSSGEASSKGEMEKALKNLLAAAGAALCVAQPELCPLLGPIFKMLGLFGTTEERQLFLDAIESQAAGKPLIDGQLAVVKKAIDNGYLEMNDGVKEFMKKIAESNEPLKKSIEKAVDEMLKKWGIKLDDYEKLRETLMSKDSNDEKFKAVELLFSTGFPNDRVKSDIVKLVAELGGGDLANIVRNKISVK